LPLGVYATDKDFVDYRLQNQALIERARLAIQRALPLVELTRHARPALAEEVVVA
jgi:FMN reductase